FPLPPHRSPESQPNPAGKVNQHFRRLAESEIAAPTPHIWSQLLHRRFHADALGPSRDLPDSPLEPIQCLRRDDAPDLRTGAEAEPEKLPFLRSRHRALCLIHLEPELLRDELRNALHHPLPRPFAANVDITVIRISNEAMPPALQLPVEFVEHEVAEQWRKWSPLRSPFHARTDQPVLHHPGIQECSNEFQQPLVLNPFGDPHPSRQGLTGPRRTDDAQAARSPPRVFSLEEPQSLFLPQHRGSSRSRG